MNQMSESSAVETSLVPRHRRKRVLVAVLVFLAGLASVSWVGSASPANSTHHLTQSTAPASEHKYAKEQRTTSSAAYRFPVNEKGAD